MELIDPFGRTVRDLRISITDRCNFRCTYCMPAEGMKWLPHTEVLSYEELHRLASICVNHFDVDGIRLTGGEPTMRAHLSVLVQKLAGLIVPATANSPRAGKPIDLAVTTNGATLRLIAQELREAGFYRPTALMEYSAIRAAFILVPFFVAGFVAMFFEGTAMMNIGLAGIAFAILGYSFPRVYLSYLAQQRRRAIERSLPMAVDLLSLGLTGGQNIYNSMSRVAKEMVVSSPVLAEELRMVREQTEIGNLELAMMQFANRTNIPEVRTLALVLSQSERLGTDIAQTLMEFSTNFRNSMRQRAESQANRANFWMLFPTIFCLWIPTLAILFAPVYHEFYKHGTESKDALQKGFTEFSNITDPKGKNALTGKK